MLPNLSSLTFDGTNMKRSFSEANDDTYTTTEELSNWWFDTTREDLQRLREILFSPRLFVVVRAMKQPPGTEEVRMFGKEVRIFAKEASAEQINLLSSDVRLTRLRQRSYARGRCGASNCTKTAKLEDYPNLKQLLLDLNRRPGTTTPESVLLRYPSHEGLVRLDSIEDKAELVNTCQMAALELGPPLLAAIPLTFKAEETDRKTGIVSDIERTAYMYVFEAGWESVFEWMVGRPFASRTEDSLQADGEELLRRVQELSKQGVLLFDSKPGNMVCRRKEDNNMEFRFIDFDVGFTAMVVAERTAETTDCITMVNLVLLLSATALLQVPMRSTRQKTFLQPAMKEMYKLRNKRLHTRTHGSSLPSSVDEYQHPDSYASGVICRILDRRGLYSPIALAAATTKYVPLLEGTSPGVNEIVETPGEVPSNMERVAANIVLRMLNNYGNFVAMAQDNENSPTPDPQESEKSDEDLKNDQFDRVRTSEELLEKSDGYPRTFFDALVKTVMLNITLDADEVLDRPVHVHTN